MQLSVWIVTNGWITMTVWKSKDFKYSQLESEWYFVFKMGIEE